MKTNKNNKKSHAFLGAAFVLLIALLFTACPNNAGGSGSATVTPPPEDKVYTVGTVSFTLKGIAAVTGKSIGHADEENFGNAPHTVSLSAYLIGETEVTQELWQAVMGDNPSFFNNTGNKILYGGALYDTAPEGTEVQVKRPAENVNWYWCIAFCNELTKKVTELGSGECVYYSDASLSTVYTATDAGSNTAPYVKWTAKGFRLPTGAEWEWAAMGGKSDKWAGTDDEYALKDYVWYANEYGGDANDKTHEVKKKLPNGYGLYDMSGNVYEWCWDRYNDSTPADGQIDPTGPVTGSERVLHGGCWWNAGVFVVRAFQCPKFPIQYDPAWGLRLACRP